MNQARSTFGMIVSLLIVLALAYLVLWVLAGVVKLAITIVLIGAIILFIKQVFDTTTKKGEV